MYGVGDPDPWSWGVTEGGGVDFVVWTLLDDGLRVTPFDRHPEGNGRLRAAGLDATSWRAWLHELVTRHAHVQASIREAHRAAIRGLGRAADPIFDRDAARRRLKRLVSDRNTLMTQTQLPSTRPIDPWSAHARTRRALKGVYPDWRALGSGRPALVPRFGGTVDGSAESSDKRPAREHGLFEEFRAARPRPQALEVFVVHYPTAAVEVIPPVSLVVGRPLDQDEDAVIEVMREGFHRLARSR